MATMATQPKPTVAPLYTHQPHPHVPRNVNHQHTVERLLKATQPGWRGRVAQCNETLAVWLTKHTGTMACAYAFAGIGVGSLIGVFTNNAFLAALFGSLSSYFLQLVLLPVLSVGQNVLSRHAELQADEQFGITQRTLHEGQQVVRHLDAQDGELLKQTALLLDIVSRLAPPASPAASPASPATVPSKPSSKPRRPRSPTPASPAHRA